MKELFNTLSNLSDFFNEKRRVFRKGPEGPKAAPEGAKKKPKSKPGKGPKEIEFKITKEGSKTIYQAKQAFKINAKRPKSARRKKGETMTFEPDVVTLSAKKGTKLSKAAKETGEAEKGRNDKLKNKVLSKIDRLRGNVQFTQVMDRILEKGAKAINSGDPKKLASINSLISRIQYEYKKWNKSRSTFPAAMNKIVDQYLS